MRARLAHCLVKAPRPDLVEAAHGPRNRRRAQTPLQVEAAGLEVIALAEQG